MTSDVAVAVGKAVAAITLGHGSSPGRIVVGKDTRLSGDMLEHAICSGISAMGVDALRVGVFPTPGVAYLTAMFRANAGIVVSASHNPYTDNGIKVFSSNGRKITRAMEEEIEDMVLGQAGNGHDEPVPKSPGRISYLADSDEAYADFLSNIASPDGLSLVIDCANGAAVRIAPKLFPNAHLTSVEPDGCNINEKCGSEHISGLCREVIERGADAGFAFDGDGDRVIAVDENGKPLTGDCIIAVCARFMKETGTLRSSKVVSTVMSNAGLTLALKRMGLEHVVTDVGDRNVVEMMAGCNASLGGEDSGHIVFSDYQTTGDGILTALMLCRIMQQTGEPLSALAGCIEMFPQVLINVEVKHKPDIESVPALVEAIRSAQETLGDRGRVLVRHSGTQSVCRVMVEARTENEAKHHASRIAGVVEKCLG